MRGIKPTVSHLCLGALAVCATLAIAPGAAAQGTFPERNIRLLNINAPGGIADIVARVLGEKLSVAWGKPVIVENIPGAGGNLAVAKLATAAPDGHTLVVTGDAAIVTNLNLYRKMPYDPVRDLAPISQIAITPNLLAVPPGFPAKTVAELVALAKKQPGKLSYAHGGVGFSQHLAGELFKTRAGIDLNQVVFRAGTSMMPDLMTGRVDMCFCNIGLVLPLMRDGKLRALAITSIARSPETPDIPTMAESGFPDFDVNAWFGLLAPARTPEAVIAKVHQEVVRALAQPEVRDRLTRLGMDLVGNSPQGFAALISRQILERKALIEAAGIERQ